MRYLYVFFSIILIIIKLELMSVPEDVIFPLHKAFEELRYVQIRSFVQSVFGNVAEYSSLNLHW